MRHLLRPYPCTLLLLFASAASSSAAADLFEAIRNGDLAAVRTAARNPQERESRGPGGATPLIYAAAFGSPESLGILLASGADVQARTPLGANALIWAAGDPTKTAALITAGADVSASTKAGRTPLLQAASHAGSAVAVRMLLDRKADMPAVDAKGSTPLLAASMAGDLETARLLLDRGADPNQADKSGVRPIHNAAANGDREMVKLLIDKGADVNVANTFFGEVRHGEIALKQLTPLMLAAPEASPRVVKMLLDAGADPNARDSRGMTALMLAHAASRQNTETTRLLLARGADPQAVSAAGETALDWAAKFNDRQTMNVLRKSGAMKRATPAPAPKPVAEPRDRAEAAAGALKIVQAADAEFTKESACISCHHQNMAQLATAAAREAGVPFDKKAADASVETTLAMWLGGAPGLIERMDPPGSPDTATFSLFGLAAQGAAPSFVTDALAANVAAQQWTDGSWRLSGFPRSPMEEGHIARTAMAVRALTVYAPPGRSREMDDRRSRARAYLQAAKPRTTDDHVWRMLGLHWTGGAPTHVSQAARKLLALQRRDGGWGPTPNLPSDAYSTGTALWGLYTAQVVEPGHPVYRAGVRYLTTTQQPDGSWFVRSRSPKFQPYFESGFPHGHDQWLSMAATAWAAAALSPSPQSAATD